MYTSIFRVLELLHRFSEFRVGMPSGLIMTPKSKILDTLIFVDMDAYGRRLMVDFSLFNLEGSIH